MTVNRVTNEKKMNRLIGETGASWRALVGVTLVYSLMTVVMTYPVAFKMFSALAGFDVMDSFLRTWGIWWVVKALVGLGISPSDLTYLYYPLKVNHAILAAEPYLGLVGTPLLLFLGPRGAYNVLFLVSFIFTGLATYLLVYYLTEDRRAAFVAGVVFAFFPNKSGQATAGHLANITTFWFPLYALSLILLLKKPSTSRAILCGTCLGVSLLIKFEHNAYFVLPFTLLFLLYHGVVNRKQLARRSFVKGLALAFVWAGGLVAPFFLPFFLDLASGELGYLGAGGVISRSVDLGAFFLPSPYHPLFGWIDPVASLSRQVLPEGERGLYEVVAYLGLTPLLLAVWGVKRRRPGVGMWTLLGAGAALLCMGPFLKVGGKLVQLTVDGRSGYVVLPYAVIRSIPFLGMGRAPARMNETVMLPLAVLAGYGLVAILTRVKKPRFRLGLTVLLAALIFFEYVVIFPFPTAGQDVPPFYEDIAQDGEDYAILNLPWAEGAVIRQAMYYQTVHQHKIVSGKYYRWLPGTREMVTNMERMIFSPSEGGIFVWPSLKERLQALRHLGIRYVIAHKWGPHSQLGSQMEPLLGEPLYKDQVISVFDLPEAEDTVAIGLPYIAEEDPRWHGVEQWGDVPVRWMDNDAAVFFYAFTEGQGQLIFSAQSYFRPRHLQVIVNGQAVEEYEVDQLQGYVTGPFGWEQGLNEINFHVDEGCEIPSEVEAGNNDGRCLSLVFRTVELLPFSVDSIGHPLSVKLANGVSLLGYDLNGAMHRPGSSLRVTLYWQADQMLPEDYSVFVHLVGLRGEMLSQGDSQPLNGRYPTSRWQAGMVIPDAHEIAIPEDAATGEYELKVGMYLPSTMERVGVMGQSGGDQTILLDRIQIGKGR